MTTPKKVEIELKNTIKNEPITIQQEVIEEEKKTEPEDDNIDETEEYEEYTDEEDYSDDDEYTNEDDDDEEYKMIKFHFYKNNFSSKMFHAI